ncbi:hypothetical protein AYI69_g10679, partial [Smittium culicis]
MHIRQTLKKKGLLV